MTKPPLKWTGGKTQLLKELLARVPVTYERYFEPFVGGGALFFALQPKVAYLRDSNAELINLYQVLRSDVDGLIEKLKSPFFKNDSDRFYEIRAYNVDELDDVTMAARTVYLNKTCFNGLYRVNSKGKFNTPYGRYKNPNICDVVTLRAAAEALLGADVAHGDFRSVEHVAKAGDFVYLDPPYIPLTRTASFTAYTPGKFGLPEHTALRDMALRMKNNGVNVLISNSSAPDTRELYAFDGFKVEEVSARRNINSSGDKRGAVTELLIS